MGKCCFSRFTPHLKWPRSANHSLFCICINVTKRGKTRYQFCIRHVGKHHVICLFFISQSELSNSCAQLHSLVGRKFLMSLKNGDVTMCQKIFRQGCKEIEYKRKRTKFFKVNKKSRRFHTNCTNGEIK